MNTSLVLQLKLLYQRLKILENLDRDKVPAFLSSLKTTNPAQYQLLYYLAAHLPKSQTEIDNLKDLINAILACPFEFYNVVRRNPTTVISVPMIWIDNILCGLGWNDKVKDVVFRCVEIR